MTSPPRPVGAWTWGQVSCTQGFPGVGAGEGGGMQKWGLEQKWGSPPPTAMKGRGCRA